MEMSTTAASVLATSSLATSPGHPPSPFGTLVRFVAPAAWAVVALKLAIHLLTNAIVSRPGDFGFFRDELYYLASTDHLAWGYVDHPALSIWILAAVKGLLGDSLFSVRLIPALAGAATVLLTARLAKELGGRAFAQTLAALGATVSLIALGIGAIYSMNAFDHLLWVLAFLCMARLETTDDRRWWLALGGVLGFGLLNKVGVLWLGLGFGLAALLTPRRRDLTTRWPWLGVGLGALGGLPFLLWNLTHDWAHLTFIENALSGKYSGLTRLGFLREQLVQSNPSTVLLWTVGLAALLVAAKLRPYRGLAISVLTVAAVLLLNGRSKAEYLAPAFPALFAAGGVIWELWTEQGRRRWLRVPLVVLLVAGLVLTPLVLPVLSVDSYIAFAEGLGVAPGTSEEKELDDLPQFYADMFGWKEKAEAVAAVYHSLSPEERAKAFIYGNNYGRAGAIDYWGPSLGLPKTIGGHNSYWLWGPRDFDGSVLIYIGGERESLLQIFATVELAGHALCDHCMPYEKDLPIFVCRDLEVPTEGIWDEVRNFS